ncbi:NADH-quinone oxidoreductase subunit NuoG [Deinococcus detaillensis]|uniref:NADH-quinone oxidoreductase n=1 Tax=Deinococcus detaillensis TaxID=2592048 RepID=A0A553V3K9_9DEIO|nr:NADH-quinone oxidoreductase subunit NuoG [Deinococcus detaillensis]TSA86811.1 NADH-quinone oxidoreductase subunit NuoG [Deinococcus detaillensis]
MKVHVDGISLDLPAGTSAIDAVFQAGKDVPYFCAHPYLSPVGACRMCLIESGSPRKNPDGSFIMEGEGDAATPKIFWFPKPMAACTMMATEGMQIKTAATSEIVAKSQAGMMEFTLLNHPLDCPTCDKGGACELQDRAFEYGYGASRFGFDRRHAEKHYPLSDYVILDQERCIHCKRCVRYFEEVPGQEVLDFIERGSHTFIDTAEGGLPVGFQGNITDICPVGALLDNVARFRGRNWEYDHTHTTCTLCPVGCSITVDARNGSLERIVAGENREVNEAWICDAGRFGHVFASENRLTTPMIRNEDGELVAATWDQAVDAIRAGMAGLDAHDLAIFLNADSTLEEGIAAEAFVGLTGLASVDYWPRQATYGTDAPTLTEIAQSDGVVVLGADLGEEAPILELRILEMLRGGILPAEFHHGTAIADLRLVERPARKREKLAVISSKPSRLSEQAGFSAQMDAATALAGLTGSSDNAAVSAAANLLKTAERPILVLGAEALASLSGAARSALQTLTQRTKTRILALPAGANARGLASLNLVPRSGGLRYDQLSQARVALISRLNPLAEGQSRPRFLISHDTHLTATALQADVILPAVTNYEKRGITVNLEGRLLPLRPAALKNGEAADFIRALSIVAEALEIKTSIRGIRSAQNLLSERLGVNVAELPIHGLIAPLGMRYDAPAAPYTPLLWKEGMKRSDPVYHAGMIELPMASTPTFVAGDD